MDLGFESLRDHQLVKLRYILYAWRLLAQQFELHLELRLYEDYRIQPKDLIHYQLSYHFLFGLHKLYLNQQFQLE